MGVFLWIYIVSGWKCKGNMLFNSQRMFLKVSVGREVSRGTVHHSFAVWAHSTMYAFHQFSSPSPSLVTSLFGQTALSNPIYNRLTIRLHDALRWKTVKKIVKYVASDSKTQNSFKQGLLGSLLAHARPILGYFSFICKIKRCRMFYVKQGLNFQMLFTYTSIF
jgi:hypothetical protein